jgi:ABC-type multidrug transport system fused ATPase/permease subunit
MRELKELFGITGKLQHGVVLLILRCPFDTLHTIICAMFLQMGFNAINSNDLNQLYLTCTLSAIGFGLLFLYNGTIWTMFATFYTNWISIIRQKLFLHISGLSLQKIDAKPSGEWVTRLNADVQSATSILGHPVGLPHAAYSLVNIIVSSIILVKMNPMIYGLIILFVIPHILISQFIFAKPMSGLATKAQEASAKNTTDMNTLVTCADITKLYDAETFLLSHFECSSLELRKANMRIRNRNALSEGLIPILGMGGYLVILLIGGVWIAEGKMTFGDLTAAFQYRGGVLVGAIILTKSLMNIKTALAGVKRVNETMQIPLEE